MIKLTPKHPTPAPAFINPYAKHGDKLAATLYILDGIKSYLPPHQVEFATSLCTQAKGTKPLSPKQIYWVDELATKAAKAQMAPLEAKPAPAPAMNVGALTGVFNLFDTAAAHLKAPKIKLVAGKLPVCLSVAGPSAKEPGTIKVTDGMQGGLWYGRIAKDGTWTPGKALALNKDALVSVYSLLVAFADDPATVAATQGKLTAKCVFCRKGLKTDESLAVGYGPDCAAHYGLPWGGK